MSFLPPTRAFTDFLPINKKIDWKEWRQRVKANLIYYQTNYVYAATIIVSLQAMNDPIKLLFGLFIIFLSIFGSILIASMEYTVKELLIKIYLCVSIIFIYHIPYMLQSLIYILIPLYVIIFHASFRSKNLCNQFFFTVEKRFPKTLMGITIKVIEIVFNSNRKCYTLSKLWLFFKFNRFSSGEFLENIEKSLNSKVKNKKNLTM